MKRCAECKTELMPVVVPIRGFWCWHCEKIVGGRPKPDLHLARPVTGPPDAVEPETA